MGRFVRYGPVTVTNNQQPPRLGLRLFDQSARHIPRMRLGLALGLGNWLDISAVMIVKVK
jgi:hypothetical protein